MYVLAIAKGATLWKLQPIYRSHRIQTPIPQFAILLLTLSLSSSLWGSGLQSSHAGIIINVLSPACKLCYNHSFYCESMTFCTGPSESTHALKIDICFSHAGHTSQEGSGITKFPSGSCTLQPLFSHYWPGKMG